MEDEDTVIKFVNKADREQEYRQGVRQWFPYTTDARLLADWPQVVWRYAARLKDCASPNDAAAWIIDIEFEEVWEEIKRRKLTPVGVGEK